MGQQAQEDCSSDGCRAARTGTSMSRPWPPLRAWLEDGWDWGERLGAGEEQVQGMHSGRGASCLSSVRRVSVACVPQLAAKCPSAAACPLTAVAGPNAPICTPPYSPSHPPHLRPPMCPTLLWLPSALKAPCPSVPLHSPLIPVVKYALAYQASLIQSSNVKSAELQKGPGKEKHAARWVVQSVMRILCVCVL